MNKLTKGALAMVLVGSVTFSITNALLADHSSKRLAQANGLTNSGDHKKAVNISQAEKTVKDQTPTTNVKDVQTTPSHTIATPEGVLINEKKSDKVIAVIQTNSTKISATSTTTIKTAPVTNTSTNSNITVTGTTSMKSAATTAPTTNSNTITTGTTSTKPATTTATTTSTTTTTTNHGKQVSQAAKEKAASHQNKKVNN
jgi:hypothetical protein